MDASSRPTIFILDDDEVVRDSLKVLLETRNFTVVDFQTARDLLHHEADANCLILDLHMPEMTGTEVLEKLRRGGDHTPAILITGRPDKAARTQASKLGVELLEKPVSPAVLIAALEKALKRKAH